MNKYVSPIIARFCFFTYHYIQPLRGISLFFVINLFDDPCPQELYVNELMSMGFVP